MLCMPPTPGASPLSPGAPQKLPRHLPDPLRPPLPCSPHAWLDKLTSCMISFFPLPPLPVLNSSKPRSEAQHKLDEQSLPVLQPCPASDQAEEGILQPVKGREEENVAQGAEAGSACSTLWRCRVTADSTNSPAALGLSHQPTARARRRLWLVSTAWRMLHFTCCRSPLALVRKGLG